MSHITKLLDALRDTDAVSERLRELEPDQDILRENLEGIRRRREVLAMQLNKELRSSQSDLVQYHVKKNEDERYPVLAVARAVAGFQELVTSVFDALRSAPKKQYRPQADNVALSTLDFAMALPVGSVLVSMSVENDRLLAVKSDLDQTFDRVFEIMNTRDSERLRSLADVVGIASISKAHDWAATAANFGLNTKIEIQKDLKSEPQRIEISNSQAQILKEIIEEKSDKQIDLETVVGELLGIDVDPNPDQSYFHIETIDKRRITGKLDSSFSRTRSWAVHVVYTARIAKVTTTKYSTGEERVEWLLVFLEPFAGQLTGPEGV